MKSMLWKSPAHITLFVTAKCNARCRMCFYWKNLNKKTNELSLEEMERISEKTGRLLWLVLTGGEPFLRNDLPEIAKAFCKNFKSQFITIPTNGLLTDKILTATEKILKTCNSKLRIKLSLDGIGKEHDKIRGMKGAFKKAMNTYKKLLELRKKYGNLDIGFTITLSNFNKHNIKEIIDFATDRKLFGGIIPSINLVRGCTREEEAKSVSAEEFESAIRHLAQKINKYKMSFLQRVLVADEYAGKEIALETIRKRKMAIPCYAGSLSIIITETGEVYPCEMLDKSFGNLRDNNYDLKRILSTKKAEDIRRFIKNKGCYCTHECNMFVNTLFNPSLYPRIAKNLVIKEQRGN